MGSGPGMDENSVANSDGVATICLVDGMELLVYTTEDNLHPSWYSATILLTIYFTYYYTTIEYYIKV